MQLNNAMKKWECKECKQIVPEDNSVAFHLVEGVLYGWCRSCFEVSSRKRAQERSEQPQQMQAA